MSTQAKEDALVIKLEAIYKTHFELGYVGFSNRTIGLRSKAMRLHAEDLMRGGTSHKTAWESAYRCNRLAYLHADSKALMTQMGAAA
jgi:hypothetical protein